jgi:hypothetical protein
MLFTTHHVVDESITLIGGRLHPARAVLFARHLLASRVVHAAPRRAGAPAGDHASVCHTDRLPRRE